MRRHRPLALLGLGGIPLTLAILLLLPIHAVTDDQTDRAGNPAAALTLVVAALGGGLSLLLARRATLAGMAETGDVSPAPTGVGPGGGAVVPASEADRRSRADAATGLAPMLPIIGDAVIVTDLEDRIAFMNSAAEALTGWSAANAMHAAAGTVFVLLDETTRQPIESPTSRVRRTGAGLEPIQALFVARGGAEALVDVGADPIRTASGGLSAIVLTFRDLVRWRHSHETAARLAAIIHSSDDAIISKDLNGVIRSWNRGAEQIFGYTAAEAVGRSIRLIIPPERQFEEDEVLRRIRRGEPVEHFETVRIRKDGTRIDISQTSSPVRNAAGEVIGASKIARDISDRKRIELERAELLQRERVARAAAEAANRGKDQFLAMLSHELRNPLGTLAGALKVLERLDHDEEAQVVARSVATRQIGQLTHLVNDLLDVARVTTGKIRLERHPVELARLVERCVETLTAAAGKTGPRVRVRTEPLWIEADETRIEQVVTNLVQNARKFTPAEGRIRVTVRREDRKAVLEVRDTGQGISEDLLPHIFDLFTQGDRPLDRSQGGLGLGLTLVQRLVAMHGGTVAAVSDGAGRGTTFTVRFPIIDAPGARRPSVSAETVAGPRRRILVIEDNADGREMLRMMLTLDGHEVAEAEDGVSGVEKALALRPDVVIMDIGLPGLDGYTAARRIRASELGRQVRLVALTGYGQPEDKRRGAEAGFDAHLVKPVQPGELRRIIADR